MYLGGFPGIPEIPSEILTLYRLAAEHLV